jgi:serine/threonine protein kinase
MQIGLGGFSEVFMVDNPKIKKPMAMKIMKISDEEKKKCLEAELRVGVSIAISCRYLIQIVEYFLENNYCFLIMEYCKQGDLHHLLSSYRSKNIKIPKKVYFYI